MMMQLLLTLEYLQILQVKITKNIFLKIKKKSKKSLDVDSSTVASTDEKIYIKNNLINVVVNYY